MGAYTALYIATVALSLKAPDHQYPQSWPNIHRIGPVPCKVIGEQYQKLKSKLEIIARLFNNLILSSFPASFPCTAGKFEKVTSLFVATEYVKMVDEI